MLEQRVECPICGKRVNVLEPYGIIGYHGPGFNDMSSPVCGGVWSSVTPPNKSLEATRLRAASSEDHLLPGRTCHQEALADSQAGWPCRVRSCEQLGR